MLKLGTAKITLQGQVVVLDYVNPTSFLHGFQTFATQLEAEQFCRTRGIRVVK